MFGLNWRVPVALIPLVSTSTDADFVQDYRKEIPAWIRGGIPLLFCNIQTKAFLLI